MKQIVSRIATVALLVAISSARPLCAEYVRIEIRVFGMDCGLCARGLAAYVARMPGVKSADVSWKKGMLDVVLDPGNTIKMEDVRKRIRDNGFRPMEANVTAKGEFKDRRFEVSGCGDSYYLPQTGNEATSSTEMTFEVKAAK